MKQKIFDISHLVIILCALFVGVATVLYPDDIEITKNEIVLIMVGFIVNFVILEILFNGAHKIFKKSVNKDKNTIKNELTYFSIFFFVLALIHITIFFPGVADPDTSIQLADFFNGTQIMQLDTWGNYYVEYFLNDHMNVFDTLLFGGFVSLGKFIGNPNIGVFIYIILQVVLYDLTFTYSIYKLWKWGINSRFIYFVMLFYCTSAFIYMYSINMTKDSLNAILFLFYFLEYIECIRENKNVSEKLSIISLLVGLTKKTGVIIVTASNIILFISSIKRITNISKKSKKVMIKSATSAIMPFLIINVLLQKILYPQFGIYQDQFRETISFSLQQVARVAIMEPSDFTDEDIQTIDRVLSFNEIKEVYNYNLVDKVRHTYKPYATKTDIVNFFRLWIREGIRHPGMYIRTMVGTNGGFFSPNYVINIRKKFWGGEEFNIVNPPMLAACRNTACDIYEYLAKTPILGWLYLLYFYSWILPCYMLWKALRQKSIKLVVSFIPVLVSVVTFYFSPTVYARYALHIILIAPVMLLINGSLMNDMKKTCV